MKNLLKSVVFLALIVVGFSTTAFSQSETAQITVNNHTTQNLGIVGVYNSNVRVGQVIVPGPGVFSGQITAPMTSITVNNVIVPKGASMKVALPNGHVITVNNMLNNTPIVDTDENN
jgi:uncharacterized membrane protein YobD (UPF0266 family)